MLTRERLLSFLARLGVGVFALAIILTMTVFGLSYRASNPHVEISDCGEATLLDKGIISHYPRYRISFPFFDLATPGTTTTRLDCVLSAPLEMWLALDPDEDLERSGRDWVEEIKQSGIAIGYSVLKENEEYIFIYSGRLGSDWIKESGQFSYFSQQGERLSSSMIEAPGVKVRVTIGEGNNVPRGVRVQPMLVGGGFEK